MAQLEQIRAKIEQLRERYEKASSKRAELRGQLDAKREELLALSEEIKQAGYDPKNLKKERDAAQAELASEIAAFEKQLVAVEAALAEFDNK